MTEDGLVTLSSAYSFAETIGRFEAGLEARKIKIFAKIDHALGAAEVGMSLPPTVLLIFGNPRAGTPLMQADQRAGLDLPLKALIWQDAQGAVWLAYNNPAWIAARHQLDAGAAQAVAALSAVLSALAQEATKS